VALYCTRKKGTLISSAFSPARRKSPPSNSSLARELAEIRPIWSRSPKSDFAKTNSANSLEPGTLPTYRSLKKVQDVAKLEARSISLICEIFLRLGVEGYEKEGSKFLQRFLSRQKKEPSE